MTARADDRGLHSHVGRVVVALARLVELERQRALTEPDVRNQCSYAVDGVRHYCTATRKPLHITFTCGVPFLRRTPLRAAPWVFNLLEPLAFALHARGWSDIRLDETVRAEDTLELARYLAAEPGSLRAEPIPNVGLGHESFVDLTSIVRVDETAPSTTLSAAYASVVAALWDSRNCLKREEPPELVRMRRASQVAVELAATKRFAASAPTSRRINGDLAARWVDTTILAVEMCQTVRKERRCLEDVALAGLFLALAPFDERGAASADGPPAMSRSGRIASPARLGARTLAVLLGIPHVVRFARVAATIACEAQRRRYQYLVGNATVNVSLEAVVVATATRFFEIQAKLSKRDLLDDVLKTLRREATGERDILVLRMLCAALGTLPQGAVIELESREIAAISTPAREGIPADALVELLADAMGDESKTKERIALALPGVRSSARRIPHVVLALDMNGESLPRAGSRDCNQVNKATPTQSAPPPKETRRSTPSRSIVARTSVPKNDAAALGPAILDEFSESQPPPAPSEEPPASSR